MRLPDTVNKDKVKLRYDGGVLSVIFSKVEAKKVKVEVGRYARPRCRDKLPGGEAQRLMSWASC